MGLLIAAAFCATLTSCRAEFAADPGTFAPSVGEVGTLLDQGRVRVALQQADRLAQRYRGPEAELLHGWALWRNGRVRDAEARFRRAVDAGSREAYAGLAAVRASTGEWGAAAEMARSAGPEGDRVGAASAVLASAAWASGNGAEAARQMQAWATAEPGTPRGRAAAAMAAATARLAGAPAVWQGDSVLLPLHRLPEGGWGLSVTIAGQESVWRLDPTFRQSLMSNRLAQRLQLPVEGPATPVERAASARWPALLSPRQAALESIGFGSLVLSNIVVGVAGVPDDTEGVVGADVLSVARWSFNAASGELAMAPPSTAAQTLPGVAEGRAIAWLRARLVREGVGTQLFVYPRVSNQVVAAGLDFAATSRLDLPAFVVPPGSSTAAAPLLLGGWRGDVQWRPASLTGWAGDGGVAPTAVLGYNVLEGWAMHWYPGSMQLRIDVPPSARTMSR